MATISENARGVRGGLRAVRRSRTRCPSPGASLPSIAGTMDGRQLPEPDTRNGLRIWKPCGGIRRQRTISRSDRPWMIQATRETNAGRAPVARGDRRGHGDGVCALGILYGGPRAPAGRVFLMRIGTGSRSPAGTSVRSRCLCPRGRVDRKVLQLDQITVFRAWIPHDALHRRFDPGSVVGHAAGHDVQETNGGVASPVPLSYTTTSFGTISIMSTTRSATGMSSTG